MSQRALAGLSLAAALISVAACSAEDSAAKPKQPTQPSRPSADAAIESPSVDSEQASVEQPPELDETETVAAEQGGTHGSHSFEFDKGKKGDALIVAVRCQGKGTIDVVVRPAEVSFTMDCLDDEVSTAYNQVGVSGVENEGTVSVEAPSTVRWSMTIGRGEAAADDDLAQAESST
ncbi:hypothetical protein ACQEVY_22785 [Streptomyces sp. CA-288835]|uniref:hypothetical protein n=1 Tax=Streptomyces sp. CA-288835 TaxID=3240069 RepID=UPI003D9488A0